MRGHALIAAFCAAAFFVPAALGDRHDGPPAAKDGCLVVDNGQGTVTVAATGGFFGRFDQGRVTIDDLTPGGKGPKVFGAELARTITETKTTYIGTDVRFRFTDGGAYRVSVTAVGIDLSAIGHGWAVVNGGGFFEPGTFSTDADSLCSKSFKPMPRTGTKLVLGAASTP
jgi:hypothetical protein